MMHLTDRICDTADGPRVIARRSLDPIHPGGDPTERPCSACGESTLVGDHSRRSIDRGTPLLCLHCAARRYPDLVCYPHPVYRGRVIPLAEAAAAGWILLPVEIPDDATP